MPTGIPIDGKVLRRLREDRLWSQEDLAARARHFAASENDRQCGLDKATINQGSVRQSKDPCGMLSIHNEEPS